MPTARGSVKIEREQDLLHLLAPLAKLVRKCVNRIRQIHRRNVDLQRHRGRLSHSRQSTNCQLISEAPRREARLAVTPWVDISARVSANAAAEGFAFSGHLYSP